MAHIRSFDEIGETTGAEDKLIAACRAGDTCALGDGTLPEAGDKTRQVRADLLRYLILGGCDVCPVAEAVNLSGAIIIGMLDLSYRKTASAILLMNCRFEAMPILLQTECAALILTGSAMPGLFAEGIKVKGNVFLRDKFHANGRVSLSGAAIGGHLSCSGGSFKNPHNAALNAEGINVQGAVFLSGKFHANGWVSLSGAAVGGQLNCDGGTFENPGGKALNAENIEVKGSVFLHNSFHATGRVNLSCAAIGGQLGCIGGTFDNPGGDALFAQGINVKEGVFLRDNFSATGEVSLSGAAIGGQMSCIGGTFKNPEGYALNTENINVRGDVFLCDEFLAIGGVSLSGAAISGQLSCNRGTFGTAVGVALLAQNLSVTDGLVWRDVTVAAGRVDFTQAHVGMLVDDLGSWPQGGRCVFDGFTYDRIAGAPTDAQSRLDWLARGDRWDGAFFPQPYVQLAKTLREMGHERDARAVLIAMHWRGAKHIWKAAHATRRHRWLPTWTSLRADLAMAGSAILWVTVGYGHAPWRSLNWLAALFLIATTLAHHTWNEGSFAPNAAPILTSPAWQDYATTINPNPAAAWSAKGAPGQDWETFNRYAYGADVVIPIIAFGQTDAWAPSTERGPWGRALWWGRWVLGTLGWIVSALGAAAVTGIIRRE